MQSGRAWSVPLRTAGAGQAVHSRGISLPEISGKACDEIQHFPHFGKDLAGTREEASGKTRQMGLFTGGAGQIFLPFLFAPPFHHTITAFSFFALPAARLSFCPQRSATYPLVPGPACFYCPAPARLSFQ